jgi:hypothetical protein
MPAVVVAVVMWESASSISKGCGKGGKTVLSFSHAFHRPSFPRPAFVLNAFCSFPACVESEKILFRSR